MAQCPHCQTQINADMGVHNCPKCGGVVLIDFEGNAQVPGETTAASADVSDPNLAGWPLPSSHSFGDAPIAAPINAPASTPTTDEAEIDFSHENEFQNVDSEYQNADSVDGIPDAAAWGPFGGAVESESGDDGAGGVYEAPFDPEQAHETGHDPGGEAASWDAVAGDEEPLWAQPEPSQPDEAIHSRPPAPRPAKGLVEELSDYANSEMSQGRDGLLVFTLTITGIDSSDLRREVQESLADARFIWSIATLMKSIRKGQLVIHDLNSVKATIVVNRLKSLPLQITWAQETITQKDVDG